MRLAAGIAGLLGCALMVFAAWMVRTELGIGIAGLLLLLEAWAVKRNTQ